MASSNDASLNSLTEISGNLHVPTISQSSNSETNGLFYQTVSEAALLQALQSTLTMEGNTTTPSLSTVTSNSYIESVNAPVVSASISATNIDKEGQTSGSQAGLTGLLGNLSATQLLMVRTIHYT